MSEKIHDMKDFIYDEENELNGNQLHELKTAIKEADNNQVISFEDFKRELGEWKKQP